jgi:hypothetical protein
MEIIDGRVAENVEFVKLKLCITLSLSLSKNKINPCKTNQNTLFPLEFTGQEIYIKHTYKSF